ncbi:MAG: ABC transporter ATP-binding protein [Clostridia bacterium]|nr:ABC transporter ATP-binding protein [Clostridia bacterium]
MEHVLKIDNISYSYHTITGETPAVKSISLTIEKGEFISIVGPSGCGKSTLLSLISGLIHPDSGTIEINGSNNIGYMFQKDNLFEWRTVYGNARLGLDIQHKATPKNLEYVNSLLTAYGLDNFKNSHPSQLSGGMRQRAALIRTLALEPDLLLLDEPFSALDYQTRLEVCDDIGTILKKEEKTAILVTHDLSEAISMGDRVVVLSHRPCTICDIIPINLSIENRTPLSSRNAPEFKDYFNIIWKELTDNA